MKKVVLKVLIAVGVFCFVSCENLETETVSAVDDTVYATESELESFRTSGYVNYTVSRYYAMAAMESFAEENDWKNVTLSEKPVVIYNAKNLTPRYYEFQVLSNGIPVGAIACVADKKEGLPVKYVLPFVSAATEDDNRALKANRLKICDSGYPSKKRILVDESGRSASADVEVFEDLTIENLTDSDFEKMGYSEEEKEGLLKGLEKENDEIASIWEKIDAISADIENLTDEELDELYEDEDSSRKVIYNSYSVIDRFYLTKWEEKSKWETRGWYCGPNCIAFILLGLGEDANNDIVPLTNDEIKIKRLYQTVENKIGKGPKLFDGLSDGLSFFAPYKLKPCFPYWETIFDYVKDSKLPCLSLRGSKGFSQSGIQFHYRVVIGTKTEKVKTILKVFGRKKTLFSWHDHFYYMHDNGSDGFNFYENSKKLNQIGAAKVVEK